jgi:hypothetical protein
MWRYSSGHENKLLNFFVGTVAVHCKLRLEDPMTDNIYTNQSFYAE